MISFVIVPKVSLDPPVVLLPVLAIVPDVACVTTAPVFVIKAMPVWVVK